LRYAELGYPVFPCVPGDSKPLTEHGFQDATTDAHCLQQWWKRQPSANVALTAAGLLIIDLDPLAANEANPWLQNDPDKLLDLAAAPTALTPRGGRHYVFRKPAGKSWRCTASRLAPGVDTRTDGGYFVAPPSRREDGSYRWVPGSELDVAPEMLPVPPPWLVEQLDHLAANAGTLPPTATSTTESNLIPAGQRNSALARLAGGMRRMGMSQDEMTAALLRVNDDRCIPPLSAREVERTAASVARYEPDQITVALAENHWEQMYAPAQAEVVDNPDPGPTPEHLLHVPGFIDEVMAYTLQTAPYPERTLAFCGALALQALLAGRKVRDEADNRTNLYVLGLANSGAGKDYPRKVNQRVLVEVGLADCLGNAFASGEGIEDRLFLQPAALYQVDEMDGLLLRVNQAKDARHEQIVNILLQMYSSANSVYVMRAKANRERAVIDQPCLCLFGTAVPKHFYEVLSARMMTNGFLARMLILESQKRGRGREVSLRPIPATVLETARWWAEFRPGAKPGNLADWHPCPLLVEQTSEAISVLDGCRGRADDEYTRAEERGDQAGMAIWARAFEKARRLALLYACSANPQQARVDGTAAAWACDFVAHQTRRMLFMAGCHASESDFDAMRKRLLEVLAKWRDQHGDSWMPFWMINRKLPWTRREHEEVRDTLLEQRLLEWTTLQSGGRPGTAYRLAATTAASA
jgi:hypothetical protein